jgi:hypothetical protein
MSIFNMHLFFTIIPIFQVMKDGRIVQSGDYTKILNSGEELTELVLSHKDALSTLDTLELSSGNFKSRHDPGANESAPFVADEQVNDSNKGVNQNVQLVQEEERKKGRVGTMVYWKYITTAYNGALVPLIFLAQVIFQGFQIGSNLWMAWAAPISEDAKPPVSNLTLVNVYVALALVSSLCIFIRSHLLVTAGCKTATILFEKMHKCIFRAPMSFFDSTPSGRILNRVSNCLQHVTVNAIFPLIR